MLSAYAIRIIAIPILVLTLGGGDFSANDAFAFEDDKNYHEIGKELASSWRAGSPVTINEIDHRYAKNPAFPMMIGAVYYLFGPHNIIVRIINAVAGSCMVGLTYDVGRRLAGLTVARTGAFILLLLPDHIFWSSLAFKDVLLGLFSLVSLRLLLLEFQGGGTFWKRLGLILSIATSAFFRIETGLVLGILAGGLFAQVGLKRGNAIPAMLSVAGALIVVFLFLQGGQDGPIHALLTTGAEESLPSALPGEIDSGSDGFLSVVFIHGWGDIWRLPFAVVAALVVPLPLAALQAETAAEVVLRLVSIPWSFIALVAVFGAWRALAVHSARAILAFATLQLTGLALFLQAFSPERHRVELYGPLVIFVAMALTSRSMRSIALMGSSIAWITLTLITFVLTIT